MHWEVVARLAGNPRIGAEVGVRHGNCTEFLLNRFRNLTLYAIDLWAERPPQDRPGYQTYSDWDFDNIKRAFLKRTAKFGDRVKVLQMDSVAAADHVADGSLDFVFIDAEHTFEGVARDILAWRPKVRPGGVLCGHDYGHPRFPGVKRAVDERFSVDVAETVWSVRLWHRVADC